MALSSLKIIYGENKPQEIHQFVPPELIRYYGGKRENPKSRFTFSNEFYNEIWQIGIIMLGLIFPNLSVPFESNDKYKEYCFGNME